MQIIIANTWFHLNVEAETIKNLIGTVYWEVQAIQKKISALPRGSQTLSTGIIVIIVAGI